MESRWPLRGVRASGLWAVLAMAGCCGPKAPVARDVCAVRSEPQALPRLYRTATAETLEGREQSPASLLCDVPREQRKLADRCEDVDDLNALLGTGKVCAPSGLSPQRVCPSYDASRITQRAFTDAPRPCHASACPNVEFAIREASGTVSKFTFYDDPSCHSAPEPGCEGAEHTCYYRVFAITSELR